MLKISGLEIDNFRSIIQNNFNLNVSKYTVIVGPNNTGKSNILRALQLFLNGNVDGKAYDAEVDFPKISNAPPASQTRITVTFEFKSSVHPRIERAVKEVEKEIGSSMRLENGAIKIRQNFTRRNNETWQIITKKGIRSVRLDILLPLIEVIRASIRFKYLPVGRNVSETISRELSNDLISTIYRGFAGSVKTRKNINEQIEKLIAALQPELEETSSELTKAMVDVFDDVKKLRLHLPFVDLNSLLPKLIPDLQDNYSTPVEYKGSGLQTSTLIFFLKYLADKHPQRHNSRVTYIWAIEEPESFLHPEKQRAVSKVLEEFSESVQTFVTTHCPHFVSKGEGSSINIVEKSTTPPFSTVIKSTSYDDARLSLGVSLLDSMFLFRYNLIVEGPSDEILMRVIWKRLFAEGRLKTTPEEIKFHASGNADRACNNFQMLTTFDSKNETKIILLIDGDDAGKKSLYGLQARLKTFGRTIAHNKDYFQLEHDLEWLFDPDVMESLALSHPSQVSMQKNTNNEITDFRVLDTNKTSIATYVAEKSTVDQLKDFESVLLKIDSAFQK